MREGSRRGAGIALALAALVLGLGRLALADLPIDLEVYLADARIVPGKVYWVAERPFPAPVTGYERGSGGVHSIAVGRDGWIYFADGNGFDILRANGRREERVYRHTTYVRDLAFDSQWRLYFSEATGAGGDGVVYRIDPGTQEPGRFVEVPLDQVDGFWAGHFAFDPDDRLYISSGNRIPAAIYAHAGGRFEQRYSLDEPITGFVFQNPRRILFTNHQQQLYGLDDFSTRTVEFQHDRLLWLNDVAISRKRDTPGPCSISGRLIGGEELWPITWIQGNGPDLFWRWVEGMAVGRSGTYTLSGLPAGHYWVRADIRADTPVGFDPREREVDCAGAVTGVDFRFSPD